MKELKKNVNILVLLENIPLKDIINPLSSP
jgi:hypothetical protein